MSHRLRIRPEAEADLAEAYQWYKDKAGAVCDEFVNEVDRTFSLIGENPAMYPVVYKNVRRALVRRFPYGVFYILEKGAVTILVVSHQARDSRFWKERTEL